MVGAKTVLSEEQGQMLLLQEVQARRGELGLC